MTSDLVVFLQYSRPGKQSKRFYTVNERFLLESLTRTFLGYLLPAAIKNVHGRRKGDPDCLRAVLGRKRLGWLRERSPQSEP